MSDDGSCRTRLTNDGEERGKRQTFTVAMLFFISGMPVFCLSRRDSTDKGIATFGVALTEGKTIGMRDVGAARIG